MSDCLLIDTDIEIFQNCVAGAMLSNRLFAHKWSQT